MWIHYFKEYCAFLFFKGALLKDTDNILIQQSENVQAARQIRFTNLKEINSLLENKEKIQNQIEFLKKGTVDFIREEDLRKKLERSAKTGKPLRVDIKK